MCPVITEIFSFEDKPMISRYSNRQKELIFAAVYFPGGCSNPSVTIRDDRSSVFLSKSNHSSVESLNIHEELLRKEGSSFQLLLILVPQLLGTTHLKPIVFSYNSFEAHNSNPDHTLITPTNTLDGRITIPHQRTLQSLSLVTSVLLRKHDQSNQYQHSNSNNGTHNHKRHSSSPFPPILTHRP